jgi:hypothetical protein
LNVLPPDKVARVASALEQYSLSNSTLADEWAAKRKAEIQQELANGGFFRRRGRGHGHRKGVDGRESGLFVEAEERRKNREALQGARIFGELLKYLDRVIPKNLVDEGAINRYLGPLSALDLSVHDLARYLSLLRQRLPGGPMPHDLAALWLYKRDLEMRGAPRDVGPDDLSVALAEEDRRRKMDERAVRAGVLFPMPVFRL